MSNCDSLFCNLSIYAQETHSLKGDVADSIKDTKVWCPVKVEEWRMDTFNKRDDIVLADWRLRCGLVSQGGVLLMFNQETNCWDKRLESSAPLTFGAEPANAGKPLPIAEAS